MKKKLFFLLFSAVLLLSGGEPVTLVRNGAPACCIIPDPAAGPVGRHAAKELKVFAHNSFKMLFRVWGEDGHQAGVGGFCFAFIYMTLKSMIS